MGYAQVAMTARQPIGQVKANGALVEGWLEWDVDNNAFFQSDTFHVAFAASALPKEHNLAWFLSQASIEIEILAGLTKEKMVSLIFGKVDKVDYDPATRVLELTGRDMTGQMIDARTAEKYQNLSAGQMVSQVAGRHGLSANVQSGGGMIGKFHEIDHAKLTQQQSEWDLLTGVAQDNGFDVWVSGKTINMQPKADASNPYVIEWTPPTDKAGYPVSNVKALKFSHALTVAEGVNVEIKTHHQKTGKSFVATANNGGANPKNYRKTISNLTPEGAQRRADAKLAEVQAHELTLEADLPGDLDADIRRAVMVRGVGSPFDQTYYPDSIKRSMEIEAGFKMIISAKNKRETQ